MEQKTIIEEMKPTLFDLPDAERSAADLLTCKTCQHCERWQCNTKVFFYCGLRKSKQTGNGRFKIKLKMRACSQHKPSK